MHNTLELVSGMWFQTICRADRALASRSNLIVLIFGAIALGAAAFYAVLFNGTGSMQPDSEGYITFALERTIGYPAFLAMFRAAGLGFKTIIEAQFLLFCWATLLLAFETAAMVRSALVGSILLVGIFSNFEVMRYCFLILSESLAATMCLLLLTLLVRFCRRPNVPVLAGMSTLAGLAMLVRPAFAPLFIVPALATIGVKWPLVTRIAAIVAPAVACVLAGSIPQYMLHGHFGTQSFLGYQLIGKVGVFATGEIATRQPAIIDRLRDGAYAVQRLQKEFPERRLRYLVTRLYYDEQRDNAMPEPLDDEALAASDNAALAAAIDVVWAHPTEYLRDIGLNLYALWSLPSLMTDREAADFQAKLAKVDPPRFISPQFAAGEPSIVPRPRPAVIVFAGRAFFILTFVASLCVIVLWFVRWLTRLPLHPALVAAAAAGAGVHAVFLLTALVQAGLPRYATVMWPTMIFMMALLPTAVFSCKKWGRVSEGARHAIR